jgi:hypothetical protein
MVPRANSSQHTRSDEGATGSSAAAPDVASGSGMCGAHPSKSSSGSRCTTDTSAGPSGGAERELHACTAVNHALSVDPAAVALDNAPRRSEPNARAGKLCRWMQTLEGLEQAISERGFKTCAVVDHHKIV